VQFLLMGTLAHNGVLMSKGVYRVNDSVSVKAESRIDPANYEQLIYMFDVDYAGNSWAAQTKMGMNGFYGANAMVSVTPWLAAGAETFWLSTQKRAGLGLAARATGAKCVATAQARLPFLVLCERMPAANRLFARSGCTPQDAGARSTCTAHKPGSTAACRAR
jgi:Eukaryotic porin